MKEDKSQLLNNSMVAGLYLGLFWVIKYFCVIFGMHFQLFNFLGTVLSLITPVLLYFFLMKYNHGLLEGKMSFWHGVQFAILLFFFASTLESIIVFIHVRWIDPVFISNLFNNMIDIAEKMNLSKSLMTQLTDQPLPSAFSYVMNNVIMANVFLGMILSLFIVPLSMHSKPQQKI